MRFVAFQLIEDGDKAGEIYVNPDHVIWVRQTSQADRAVLGFIGESLAAFADSIVVRGSADQVQKDLSGAPLHVARR